RSLYIFGVSCVNESSKDWSGEKQLGRTSGMATQGPMRQPLSDHHLAFKGKTKCSLAIFSAADRSKSSVSQSGIHWTWILAIGILQSNGLLHQIVHAIDCCASASFPGHPPVYL